MIDDSQVYVVVDIEADGPIAGLHSMLAIGAVATTKDVASFYRTMLPIKGAEQDPDTMDWWKTQPEAWAEVNKDAKPAKEVMREFYDWVKSLSGDAVFVAHPISFDYSFMNWYLHKFIGKNPFTNDKDLSMTLDLRSFVSGKFGLTLDNSHRSKLPDILTVGMPSHSHNALDDALGYAVILRNILKIDSLR